MEGLPSSTDPALLVGLDGLDDAGVYRLNDELALVQSVDFFTPIVDDPYDFGRIAAANALSDLYAMGARPLTALNLLAVSLERLDADVAAAILRGGADAAAEANVTLLGGHSIDDPEPKYGMAVTGVAHPDAVVRNSTGRPGDVLFLTKPIGGGAVTTAAKRGRASAADVARATEVMATLNARAADAALGVGPSAMTDVTGFGLLGHLHELAAASGLSGRLHDASVPILDGADEMIAAEGPSGGGRRNREFLEPRVGFPPRLPEERRALLCDPMTSGGLLVAVPSDRADEMEDALRRAAPGSARIGALTLGNAGRVEVV
jgi:selenide,water dikinase